MDPTPDNTPASPGRKKPRKPLTARRLRRKVWRAFLFLTLAMLLALLVVTRTGVTSALVLPRLQSATNLDIEARSVIVASDLSIVMRDARIRIPGLDGASGELLTVDKLVAHLDWLKLPSPSAVREIGLERPRLRVSQSKDTGDINAASLALFGRVRGGEIATLPTVMVRDGVFEMGEHDAEGYEKLAEVPFSGVLAPQPGATSGRSLFSLTPRAGESGIELTGLIDASGVTFSLGGLTLDEWPTESVPTRMRDLWSQLALDGRIVPRRVTISPTGDVEIVVNVERVAVTLPFDAESARSDERARLTEVNGSFLITERTVSADLTGRVSTLTQHVVFDLWGFDAQSSPFAARLTTEPFRLERDIELLNYVPELVHEQNEQFSHPEADVEADIWIARGRRPGSMPAPMTGQLEKPGRIGSIPGGEADDQIRLEGSLTMRNGTAAFEGFPYRFRDMFGVFRFTKDTLRIVEIRGEAPTGARLSGTGVIGPLGDTAAVDLDLRVDSLPIDEALKAVLSPNRRELLESLISVEEHKELIDAGLLRPWDEAEPLLDRLTSIKAESAAWTTGGIAASEIQRLDAERREIEAELARLPAFRLGGVADATIKVIRHEGLVSVWERDIRLTMNEFGLLSKFFPLPTTGRDVTFTITDDHSTFRVEEGVTLSGGTVAVDAAMRMGDEDAPPSPNVKIEARGVPIDGLLIHAIAGPDSEHTDEGPGELTRLLRTLDLQGSIDSEATVFPDGDRVGYRIETTLRDVTASIADAEINASGISGGVVVEPSLVSLDLAGAVEPAGIPVRVDDARLAAVINLPAGRSWGDRLPGRAEPMIEASVSLPGADLRIPAERLIDVFDTDTADRVRALRERHQPEGVLDAETRLAGRLGQSGVELDQVTVAVTGVQRLAFDTEGMRIEATNGAGSATIHLVGQRRAVFDGFSVTLLAEGRPSGRLGVSDEIPIGDDAAEADWRITLAQGRFESPLTRRAVAGASAGVASLFDTYDPAGLFDLNLHRRGDGSFEGELAPGTLSIATPRGRADFDHAEGMISFGPPGGRLTDVVLNAPGTAIRVRGGWTPRDDGADLDFTFDLETEAFSDPLLGLAPPVIGALFDSLDAGVEGPFRLREFRLTAEALESGGIGRFETRGEARVEAGRLSIGVPVTELDGTLTFEARREAAQAEPVYALTLEAERWRLLGLRMTNGRADVLSGREPGSVLVPTLSADAHGGRFTGTVRMAREPGGEHRYWTDVQLAEVRLAPLLEDVRTGVETPRADEDRPDAGAALDPAQWDQSEDRSRGLANASVSLTGVVGSESGRRGRGRVIASGGPVVMLPLLTPLIEFSNLQPPVGDELRLALAGFYLDESGVTFEDIAVFSDSVELLGYGSMTWPGGELDLRVRSQAVNRIPVVSGMIESVRDELLTTRLTGPVGDPSFSTESFAATRRVMGSLFGGDDNPNRRRLREISFGADAARLRIRTAESLMDRIDAGDVSPSAQGGNDAP